MSDSVKLARDQVATAKLVSSARTHTAAKPSPTRLKRIAERTKRDSIWRSK